jgi:APA family basic amino acid/polyamine antiporter
MNLPAFLIVIFVIAILIKGTKSAANANNFIVILKVSAVIFVVIAGAFFINIDNWSPFVPPVTEIVDKAGTHQAYGFGGIVSGAAAIFFAYVGFDAVSTQAGEAINPKKDVPFAIIMSLIICTVLYILVSLVLTGMVRYDQLDVKAPVASAFEGVNMPWATILITIAAVAGLISVMMVMMLGQTRVFLGMAKDGLLPAMFCEIHTKFKTPGVINTSVLSSVLIFTKT